MKTKHFSLAACLLLFPCWVSATTPRDGSVLPFPTPVNKSVAAQTLAESTLAKPTVETHLPEDAPNILIVLLDDVGYGVAETFGGGVKTPTLSKLAD